MKQKHSKVKEKFDLLKRRMKYFSKKTNQVFICMVNYNSETLVNFGVSYFDEPYEKERELKRGIYVRTLKSGRDTYVTNVSGEYCTWACNLLKKNERIIIAYNPKKWSFRSRDEVLLELFLRTNFLIKEMGKAAEEEYEKGKASLEQFNERLRKSNMAQFEIDQLIEKYCYTNV